MSSFEEWYKEYIYIEGGVQIPTVINLRQSWDASEKETLQRVRDTLDWVQQGELVGEYDEIDPCVVEVVIETIRKELGL